MRFSVRRLDFFERAVTLRMPFRFGVVTLTAAPQAFVRARIRLDDGREGWGAGAEILAPKWFDKNLALSNEDNFDQLRLALRLARDAYLDGAARSAFGHSSRASAKSPVKRKYSVSVKTSWPWLSCSGSQSAPLPSTAHGTLPSAAWNRT